MGGGRSSQTLDCHQDGPVAGYQWATNSWFRILKSRCQVRPLKGRETAGAKRERLGKEPGGRALAFQRVWEDGDAWSPSWGLGSLALGFCTHEAGRFASWEPQGA